VQTEGTGLNRRNRWTTEKAASGSSFQDAAVSGNVANAQATARRSASNVSSFHPICRVDSGLTIITGFEATGQRVCITQEYRVIGIGQNQPPLFSHQWMFRLCCCRWPSSDGRRCVVHWFLFTVSLLIVSFSAYNVREEWWKGSQTLMDIINYVNRCSILPRGEVLPTYSTTPISGYGMRSDTDHAFHTPSITRIPLRCTSWYSPPVLRKSFSWAPSGTLRANISRVEFGKGLGTCSGQGPFEAIT
jgi:hypothetical protein